MTVRWVTTPKDRMSRRFKELHKRLEREVKQPEAPEPDKISRKRAASNLFRDRGE